MKKKNHLIALSVLIASLVGCNGGNDSSTTQPGSNNPTTPTAPSTQQPEKKTGTVTIGAVEHGSVTADKMTAEVGADVTFTVAPEANYVVSSFKVNDADVALDGNNQAVVVMVAGGLNVTASFELGSGTVTIGTIEHGAVTADKMTAKIGEDVTFKITSDTGYDVSSFKVNGSDADYVTKEDSTTGKTYWEAKVKMVSGGLTVTAEFKLAVYSIEWDTPTHGTIAVEGGKTSATYGDEVKFIFTPETGYEIKYLTINEEPVQWASDNTYTTTMGEYGLFITVQFGLENETITVNAGEHGTIEHKNKADDSQDYLYGDTAVVTVTPNEGFMIETITVDGKAIEVPEDKKGGYSFEQSVEKDLNISATFTDVHTISEFTDSVINEIKNAQDIKVKLAGDVTLGVTLPLAKGTTEYDLDGHTITSTLNGMLRDANTDTKTFGNKSVTLKNGSIVSNYDKGTVNVIDSSYLAAFTLDGVTVSNSSISTVNPITGIYCSSTTETKILNSTINIKGSSNLGAYGIGTNNLDGENKTITIDNTKVTVTSDDFDNTGFLGNTEGIKVVVKNSTFTADRQAVIARTGNWDISGSTFVSTGKWLNASEANVTTNTKYKTTAGSWKAGNEVVSGGLILGDETTSAYNTPVVATLKDNKFIVAKGDKMSIHSDGTVATTVTMDALTAVEAYGYDHDEDKTTVVTENNVVKKTLKELNEMTTDDDANLYVTTGVLTEIKNAQFGNLYLTDKATGEELYVYGTYLDNNYSFDGTEFLFDKGAKVITSDYLGKEITIAGTFKNCNGTKELVNAVVIDSSAEKVAAKVVTEYDAEKGTVTVEEGKVGDKLTVTATPKEGYKVSSIKVNDQALTVADDNTAEFTAELNNKVVVEFVSESAVVKVYTVSFVKDNCESSTDYVSNKAWKNTTDGLTYSIVNCANNNKGWDFIKAGSKKKDSIATITTDSPFTEAIAESAITIDSVNNKFINSIKLLVSTSKDFTPDTTSSYDVNVAKDKQTTKIKTPVANAYYRYVIDCKKASSNGPIAISKITFTTVAE